MDCTTGKCADADCSQFGLEKNLGITMLYGYGKGASAICPECENPLVVNGEVHYSGQQVEADQDGLSQTAMALRE